MTTPEAGYAPGDAAGLFQPVPVHLFDQPLDYLQSDHARQRGVFALLHALEAGVPLDPAFAADLRRFLERDLRLHHADEEDLFPVLRKRARPADEIEPVLAELQRHHRAGDDIVAAILPALAAIAETGRALAPEECRLMRGFADDEQRHLAVENAVVLAIARLRLRPADLWRMSQSMRQRRGVTFHVPDA